MARVFPAIMATVCVLAAVGCGGGIDSGKGQLLSEQARQVTGTEPMDRSEADLVEQTTLGRGAYRRGLEALVQYYSNTGNHMKLSWATDEMEALDQMPQFNYIIEAVVAGPDLRATTSIPLADYIYDDAIRTEKKARKFIIYTNKDLLKEALDKYNALIRKHPASDKIDDAAYHAAGIYQTLKDYSIAILYYQRASQWDPESVYPARYKRAVILDEKLHRRAEALELYRQALAMEKLSSQARQYAEQRISEMTRADEDLDESK